MINELINFQNHDVRVKYLNNNNNKIIHIQKTHLDGVMVDLPDGLAGLQVLGRDLERHLYLAVALKAINYKTMVLIILYLYKK